MPDLPNTPPTKSGLPPHVWAAISAVTVALIGAAATLTTTWLTHARASASPAPPPGLSSGASTTAAGSEADPGLARLKGHWKGIATLAGQPSQSIEVEISGDCASGAACGWIAVPEVPCKGAISLVGPDPNGFEFKVDHFDASSDAQRCQPGGGEVLRATGDGSVIYTATYSGARGVLNAAP
jgi:hypothetical protein